MAKRGLRMWSSLLAMVMMAVLILSACSEKENKTNSSPSASGTASASDSPQASASASAEELPPVKLKWYIRNAEPANAASVIAKANEIIQDKINATVEFVFINPGDYDTKMQLIMSANEEYDIAYTAAWTNNYLNNISKGAYIPLDDLLANYPDLKGIVSDGIWDAVRVNGKIYGIPNNQIMAGQSGIWFKKDLVDKYQIDLSSVKTAADLTPIYQKIKDNEPNVSPIREGIPSLFTPFEPIVEGFAVDTQNWTVSDANSGLYLDNYKLFRDWYQKGFFPQDVATLKDDKPLIQAGQIFSRSTTIKPGVEADLKVQYGIDTTVIPYNDPVIKRGTVQSTISAISATSKNPERAMMLLNLVNTDKELYNLLVFGIEGQDYKKVSDNRIEPIAGQYQLPGYMLGNVFNSYVIPGQADDVHVQTEAMNKSAALDPLITFDFDRTNVENEIAQITAVRKEYEPVLKNGLDDVDKTIKAYNEKMKAAGADKVIAEIEKQLAAWRAANP